MEGTPHPRDSSAAGTFAPDRLVSKGGGGKTQGLRYAWVHTGSVVFGKRCCRRGGRRVDARLLETGDTARTPSLPYRMERGQRPAIFLPHIEVA